MDRRGHFAALPKLKSFLYQVVHALSDDDETIDDFISGLQHGRLGAYATDVGYTDKIKSRFEEILDYYKNSLNDQKSDVDAAIDALVSNKNSYTNFRKGMLTQEAAGQLLELLYQRKCIQSDLTELNKLQ